MKTMAQPRRTAFARTGRVLAITALAGLLGACAQQPKSLYTWEGYQPTVYAYLKEDGNDYAVQAQTLEKSVEKARATNRELPPGFRAHLGMLYLKMGDGEKGVEQLQGEKQAFPESTPFMDFLMRNAGKPAAAPQAQATPQGQAETQAQAETPAAEPAAKTAPAVQKKKGS
ncbi:DUF4810 domain-containing protein [Achromobacter sp. Marseille-Q0513]|uniref:DUF4810 domain-containing protein n=1 Tax=Achromobacter sp. Marseille-Q0513 TaxID=2829161 RepID=UPI001B93FBE7|nr:DUF4810 domain-containing protein [Achromobacter sp. Marseille-Q0513]MBR8656071.1 DUF4810 domain-containing protein [Achromobacter sp. Marseille-Q0513]